MTTRQNGRPAATTRKTHRRLLGAALWTVLCLPVATALAAPPADSSGSMAPAATNAAQPIQPPALPAASPPGGPIGPALPAATSTPVVPPTQAPEPAADATSTGRIKSLLDKAVALLGTPYRWGGNDPAKGFDCSGLVGYVFRTTLGIELPRVSRDMARNGEPITDRAKLAAGDLVFFGLKGRVNHVGIYLGNGQFLHAPSRGKDVSVSSLEKGYWSGRFLQARRVDAHDGS